MKAMAKRIAFLLPVALFLAAAPTFGQDAKVQRGKYLVEEVARCQECHTPKTDAGDFDTTKMLKGTKLNIAAITPITGWHAASPDLTSTSALWQRWGDDGMIKFLETAKNPRGGKAGAPMPAYAMKHEDAEAIAAYLKSLP
jgi:mono/diheme cytochrome c family protein